MDDIPFSLEYIRSRECNYSGVNDFQFVNKSTESYVSYSEDSLKYLLLTSSIEKELYIYGFCIVTLLKGSASLYGSPLLLGKRYNIIVSSWTPATNLIIETSSKLSGKCSSNRTVNMDIKKYNLDKLFPNVGNIYETLNKTDTSTVILVENFDFEKEWILTAEDPLKIVKSIKENPLNTGKILYLSTAVIGSKEDLSALSIDCQTVPENWENATDAIMSSENESTQKVLVCGAKGVGKSTCMKYTLNRFFRK